MSSRYLPESDYLHRQQALRKTLEHREHEGVLIWSRGAGALDRYSDLFYMCGFYPVFPTLRDLPGYWADRGMAALLITSDRVVLFTDEVDAGSLAFGVTDVVERFGRNSRTLVDDIIGFVTAQGIRSILQVGTDGMSGAQFRALQNRASESGLEVGIDDQVIQEMRIVKSPAEIAMLRQASTIAGRALAAGFEVLEPGIAESRVAGAISRVVAEEAAMLANALVRVYPRGGKPDINKLPVHSRRKLQAGDTFTVDVTGAYGGYFFDIARSRVVGSSPTPDQERAYELSCSTVDSVVAALKPGRVLGEACAIGTSILEEAGMKPKEAKFPARGHGLGLGFEAPWLTDEESRVIQPGMVLAVEQFCMVNGAGATFERNVVITEDGAEDLAPIPDFWA